MMLSSVSFSFTVAASPSFLIAISSSSAIAFQVPNSGRFFFLLFSIDMTISSSCEGKMGFFVRVRKEKGKGSSYSTYYSYI